MYKLLLVVRPESEDEAMFSSIFTREADFSPVLFTADADEAARLIQAESFDAVGVYPGTEAEARLYSLLTDMGSAVPLYIPQMYTCVSLPSSATCDAVNLLFAVRSIVA